MKPIRETVFDQSFAMQERIDIILRSLHDICMKPMTLINLGLYERNILRLKKEAQTKFSFKEKEMAIAFIAEIKSIKDKWGRALYQTNSPIQAQAKHELHNKLDEYEDWLYMTLDKHGMLMRDRAPDTDATRIT